MVCHLPPPVLPVLHLHGDVIRISVSALFFTALLSMSTFLGGYLVNVAVKEEQSSKFLKAQA